LSDVAKSIVFIIHAPGILEKEVPSGARLSRMLVRGMSFLTGGADPAEVFFNAGDRIGIKVNTLGGKRVSTRPEITLALAGIISPVVSPQNITIWDRSCAELKQCGYRLNPGRGGFRILGTDTQGVGYERELTAHRSIGSLFSSIQNQVTASISLAVLKDHGLAGITAGMKNYFGAIHNPNKYHDDNCNPFIADLFDHGLIKDKHRLTVLDCLRVQYHRGPSYHREWSRKYESVLISKDPVAADFVGWTIIERLRAEKGLPPLREEGREPIYLRTAEKLGLGTANPENISIVEEDG